MEGIGDFVKTITLKGDFGHRCEELQVQINGPVHGYLRGFPGFSPVLEERLPSWERGAWLLSASLRGKWHVDRWRVQPRDQSQFVACCHPVVESY